MPNANFNVTGQSVGSTLGKFGLGGLGLALGGPLGGLIGRTLGAPLGSLVGGGLSSLFGPRGLGLLLNHGGTTASGTSAPAAPAYGAAPAATTTPSSQFISPTWGSAAYSPHISATRVTGTPGFAMNNMLEVRKRNQM